LLRCCDPGFEGIAQRASLILRTGHTVRASVVNRSNI